MLLAMSSRLTYDYIACYVLKLGPVRIMTCFLKLCNLVAYILTVPSSRSIFGIKWSTIWCQEDQLLRADTDTKSGLKDAWSKVQKEVKTIDQGRHVGLE